MLTVLDIKRTFGQKLVTTMIILWQFYIYVSKLVTPLLSGYVKVNSLINNEIVISFLISGS